MAMVERVQKKAIAMVEGCYVDRIMVGIETSIVEEDVQGIYG